MRTAMQDQRGIRRIALILGLALIGVCAFAGTAEATPKPAWKLLAVTGPTNLPPKQSETQRVAVEADGGTFTLGQQTVEGEGTFAVHLGAAEITEGSDIAKVHFAAEPYAVGERVVAAAFPAGTTILGISGSPGEPVLELSNPAAITEEFEFIETSSNVVTGVTISAGVFHVGDLISAEALPPGTTVTTVGSGTLTLSDFPIEGGTFALIGSETTAPIPFNASAAEVQAALEALPGFVPGSGSVNGGPGGDADHPYFVAFGGPLAEQNVPELVADSSALVGVHAAVHIFTIVPGGPGTGVIGIDPANIGGKPTVGVYTVQLGPLPSGVVSAGKGFGEGWSCPGGAGESTVTCTSSRSVPSLVPSRTISIPIELESSKVTNASVPVTITGGGAGTAGYQLPVSISNEQAKPGAQAFWAGAFDEEGNPSTQAGGHPHGAMSYFLATTVRSANGRINPAGDSKDVIVDLPPGFRGNPMVTRRCPQAEVAAPPSTLGGSPLCNEDMSVGTFEPVVGEFGGLTNSNRIFNDVPARGYAAEFTTAIAFPLQSLLASVRSEDDYGIRITAANNPTYRNVYGAFAALEGIPTAANGKAFLTNPSSCAEEAREAPVANIKSDTWQEPGNYSLTIQQVLPAVTGCDKLQFHPSFSFQPTDGNGAPVSRGGTGVGITAHLHIPQDGLTDPAGLAPPDLKKAVVTLPEGLVLNPSSANGLEACSEAEIGFKGSSYPLPNPLRFNEEHPSCPDGSKLGSVEVNSPLLEAPLVGAVYLAAQEENPFGSLIAIYLVIDDPRTGVVIKLPGEVHPDPQTGQLTATFDYNPQLPFEDLILKFRGGGPRSELATPEVCGTHRTTGSWTPWSAPESGPPAQTTDDLTISDGCAPSAATRRFSPSFEAGTTDPLGGAFSPLMIKVKRNDGEQELKQLDFTMPPGLVGKLAGIPYCSEDAIREAEGKSGKAEQARSSCPAASELGRVQTAAGVGPEPFTVGGHVYLAGPYKGAPVSTVVITPAVAGPFDLGNVVVRAPIYLNPETAQLTVKSDPIPTILKGFPLKVRSVEIAIDRHEFTLNPTSCEAMLATASIQSSDGASASPSNRFQVGNCGRLKFAPKLKIALKGGTKRNGHPALVATLNQPAGQANIGRVSVGLPHSEFLEQGHIRTICTRVQFAAHECPKGAIYGFAEAISPLLDQPLKGPVYLRSSSHKLPDLVAALSGPPSQPIEIDLDGRIDSVHEGIRNTFEVVPDAPVSHFVLRMQGGKKGLLVNSTNICRGTHKATVRMIGQNGKRHNFSTPLQAKCGAKGKHKKKHRGKKH